MSNGLNKETNKSIAAQEPTEKELKSVTGGGSTSNDIRTLVSNTLHKTKIDSKTFQMC